MLCGGGFERFPIGLRTGSRTGPRWRASANVKSSGVVVKRSRRGRTLCVNGTFASWYAPGRVTTGSVWDALAIPVLLLPPARCRSVLLLGLGGGSAARVVRALRPRTRIVGVERDPEVLRAARRWFALDDLGIEVVEGDALAFLQRTRRRFDVILEDVFVGNGDAVRKPDWLPTPALALARRRLAPMGVLASNTLDEAPDVVREMRGHFPTALSIGVADYDNRVIVGAARGHSGRALRSAASREPLLATSLRRLCFRTL